MRRLERVARAAAFALAAALAAALLAAPALAADPVPVRVRVVQGTMKGPAKFDSRLEDLKRQLSQLAYQQWEQKQEKDLAMSAGKTEWIQLPNGDQVGLTLLEVRPDAVAFEVALSAQNTQSRLSIDRGQRIVHQVTREKDGVALFLSVHAWP
jgi:hypothetical protein